MDGGSLSHRCEQTSHRSLDQVVGGGQIMATPRGGVEAWGVISL